MALSISHAGAAKKIGPSKIVVGVLVAAMTSFVGLAGVAGATSDRPQGGGNNHGYGNGNINVNLNVNGNNNHISIIIRYIFGG